MEENKPTEKGTSVSNNNKIDNISSYNYIGI